MSKSVLLIDTPKNCKECKLTYLDEYWDDYYCAFSGKYIENYNQNRSPDCPLSPLPSSINLKQYVDNAELNMESMLAYQYAQGWNEFRNSIIKGD